MNKIILDDEEKDILESYERGMGTVESPKKEKRCLSSTQEIHCKKTRG